jgi:CheY-like chemotaxis protein
VSLTEIVSNLSGILTSTLGERIRLQAQYAPGVPPVYADAAMIEQILVNLAMNARDAMPDGGQVTVSVAAVDVAAERAARFPEAVPGRFACLTVADTGRGMEAATLKRLFEPFFTTKEVGKGTGLGLATVYGLVKQHEGWIEAESKPGAGTTFRAYFPIAAATASSAARVMTETSTKGGQGETVLVVEDEPALRALVKRICERAGYRVIEAETGEHAWTILGGSAERVDLLLTDLIMPGAVSGKELAMRLQQRNPRTKVIFTSGYSQETVGSEFFQEGVNFLQKPYQPPLLTRMIQGCLRPVN